MIPARSLLGSFKWFWVILLHAFGVQVAKFVKSYHRLDGGFECVAMEMLTGKPSLCVAISVMQGGTCPRHISEQAFFQVRGESCRGSAEATKSDTESSCTAIWDIPCQLLRTCRAYLAVSFHGCSAYDPTKPFQKAVHRGWLEIILIFMSPGPCYDPLKPIKKIVFQSLQTQPSSGTSPSPTNVAESPSPLATPRSACGLRPSMRIGPTSARIAQGLGDGFGSLRDMWELPKP